MECPRSLKKMPKHYKITLIWVPGHQDIESNCIANELARKGTTIEILQEKDTIGLSIATCRLSIKQKTLRQAELSELRNLQTDMTLPQSGNT